MSQPAHVLPAELTALPLDTPDQLRDAALRVLDVAPAPPLPGAGSTVERWLYFAELGAWDLCVFKVVEAHYDACAILAELGYAAPLPGELWGVWAAEPPDTVLTYCGGASGAVDGLKAWCSGARLVSHALITARRGDSRCLVAVDMAASGIAFDEGTWQAIGMQRVDTLTLGFTGVPARVIGADGAYLQRAGFWHGGGGVAAGWLGAAGALVAAMAEAGSVKRSPHGLVHLGALDTLMAIHASYLLTVARMIDDQPALPHDRAVMQLRASIDRCCEEAIARSGRATGAGPLCLDRRHARRVADLQVFTRQAHAERDLQALGDAAIAQGISWTP